MLRLRKLKNHLRRTDAETTGWVTRPRGDAVTPSQGRPYHRLSPICTDDYTNKLRMRHILVGKKRI